MLLLRVSYFAKRHSKESISKGIALSGTQHYAYLKKARRQTAKLRVEPASFAPAQEHCLLPGKLDALFAFPGAPDASPKPLLAADDNQIEEVLLLHMKALRRAAQRLMTFKNHLSTNPFGKVSSKLSAILSVTTASTGLAILALHNIAAGIILIPVRQAITYVIIWLI